MCGIAGLHRLSGSGSVDRDLLDRMNGRLIHRGPDDGGLWADDRTGLAMRRLSIIDVSTGRQPLSNEDGTAWIVFNGEIYNFQALRAELEAKGHRFKTHGDTETIVHLYEEMGPDCVTRLRGMFAFALWDKKRELLLLARDRFGKKPLFYTEKNGRLAWASELQSLEVLDDWSRDVDPEALDLYLSHQYIPSPRTIYKAVRKLPPAHRLVAEKGKVRVERYWDLPLNAPAGRMGLAEAKEAIREKLRESVKLRMISEVPLGAFLSGGVDSSAIVAMMSGLSEKPVKTFSIGFEEQDFSELPYAREVARRYGTDHTEYIVKPRMTEILPVLARHYGEPYADSSALPTYYVARETRRHVTVALNGDGGDENFAGYRRYMAMKVARAFDVLPAAGRRALRDAASWLPEGGGPQNVPRLLKRFLSSLVAEDEPGRHLRTLCYFTDEAKKELYTDDFAARTSPGAARRYLADFYARAGSLDFVNRMLYVDFSTYLPECLMTKVDIASMAVSLEARAPLLDHEFVELVFRMPGAWKLKGIGGLKWIFKEAVKDLLPPSILNRPKQGFGIPVAAWFKGPLRDYWRETVMSSRALARGYFREDGLRRLFEEHQGGRRDHGYRMWALLMLELWHCNAARPAEGTP